MKRKKRIILVVVMLLVLAAAGAAAFFLLPKKEQEIEPEKIEINFPLTYQLNDIEVPALQPVQQEPEEAEDAKEKDEKAKEEPAKEEKKQKDQNGEGEEAEAAQEEDASKPTCEQESISVTYVYHNFPDLLESITQYVSTMTGGKGYFAVDEEMQKKKATAAEGAEGTYSLARVGQKEGTVICIKIDWAQPDCNVTVSYMPGEIKEPSKDKPENYYEMTKAISILEVKEFIWSLPPSVLGLEGDSMADYQIYTTGVDVVVDGKPCIRLNIFMKDKDAGTNVLVGEYCLSRTGESLYKIQEDTNRVKKVELPQGAGI